MKKTLLVGILSFLWLAVPVKAQLEKGTRYLGGTLNLGGSYQKPSHTNENKISQVTFQPSLQFGKMIRPNRMVGIEAAASWHVIRYKSINNGMELKDQMTRSSYTLSPFVRQYKSIHAKFAIFLQTSLDLSYLRLKTLDADTEQGHEIGLKIMPGIAYWVTPRFAVESDINILSLGVGYQDFLNTKSVNFNSAVTTNIPSYFSVRASWYFQKK